MAAGASHSHMSNHVFLGSIQGPIGLFHVVAFAQRKTKIVL